VIVGVIVGVIEGVTVGVGVGATYVTGPSPFETFAKGTIATLGALLHLVAYSQYTVPAAS
jgi:hypothetical protein